GRSGRRNQQFSMRSHLQCLDDLGVVPCARVARWPVTGPYRVGTRRRSGVDDWDHVGMRSVRVGAGQGFYGDTPDGAVDVARNGDVSYICFDALAELTMAILQKDRMRDPGRGFARDLPAFMESLLALSRERGIKLIT